jgi:proteasome lid subunit RPN8/RPN11
VTPFTLPGHIYEALLAEARRSLPNECCGLLGGHGRNVTQVFRATNELNSPQAYEIPLRELFAIFRRIRSQKLELVGIYHSHPTGDNLPSARDRERAYYPEAAYVILSPRRDVRRPLRAFALEEGAFREFPVEVTGQAATSS